VRRDREHTEGVEKRTYTGDCGMTGGAAGGADVEYTGSSEAVK
jgi:hypothetical protein